MHAVPRARIIDAGDCFCCTRPSVASILATPLRGYRAAVNKKLPEPSFKNPDSINIGCRYANRTRLAAFIALKAWLSCDCATVGRIEHAGTGETYVAQGVFALTLASA